MATGMTYARARLWLGISCVGTMVVVSVLLLLFRVPAQLLARGMAPFGTEVAQFVGVLFAYAFLSGPFDFFGGYILPKEYERSTLRFPQFLGRWLRGVLMHSTILLIIALTLLNAAKVGGFGMFLGTYLALNLILLLLQPLIANLLAGSIYRKADTETEQAKVRFAANSNSYYTGGIAGLPGMERVIVPDWWRAAFTAEQMKTILLRRTGVLRNGSRTRGLLLALLWNTFGACLSALLSGHLSTVGGLVTFSLWFTLWNFIGLLLLPAPSQRGVFGGDTFALRHGAEKQILEATIAQLDTYQDDEVSRFPSVETYFHPIPSVERRLTSLDAGGSAEIGAWHGARMAIYLSWAGGSFLSRAVHCNCGRPDVWAFLPCD